MTYKQLINKGTELARVEHGDMLRTVRCVFEARGLYYQTEHEEEAITGEEYDGYIVAQAPTLEGLLAVGDPNVIEDLVEEIKENLYESR